MKIEIGKLNYGTAGSCGGDQFGKDGLTEIFVDGKMWGFVHTEPGREFSLSWDNGNGYRNLGRRKNRETARKAATARVD